MASYPQEIGEVTYHGAAAVHRNREEAWGGREANPWELSSDEGGSSGLVAAPLSQQDRRGANRLAPAEARIYYHLCLGVVAVASISGFSFCLA